MVIADEAVAPERPTELDPGAEPEPWRPRHLLALGTFAIVYVIAAWRELTAAPGLNHDGQNLGVFALGSRGLRESGPIVSHLGSHLAITDVVYANHPPLIYWVTALSESLLGVHPWSTRLPTILAGLSLIVLLPRLLRTLGHDRDVAVIATIATLGSVMFFVYGAMLDTPMLGLPLAVAAITEWVRWDRGEARSSRTLVILTVLCCLAGWEAVALCWMAAGVGLFRSRRDRDPVGTRRRGFVLMALAAAGTTALVGAWIRWSYGGFDDISQQFLRRSGHGASNLGLVQAMQIQSGYLNDVFGWGLLLVAAIGLVAAGRRREIRSVVLLIAGVVTLYSLMFWQAATYHDYWHYWMLLPIAVGLAEVARWATSRFGSAGRLAAALVAVALVGVTVGTSSVAEQSAVTGFDMASLLDLADRPADQSTIYTVGFGEPTSWVSYDTGLPVVALQFDDIASAARAHPSWRVLIYCASTRRDGGPPPCESISDPSAHLAGGVMSVPVGVAAAAT